MRRDRFRNGAVVLAVLAVAVLSLSARAPETRPVSPDPDLSGLTTSLEAGSTAGWIDGWWTTAGVSVSGPADVPFLEHRILTVHQENRTTAQAAPLPVLDQPGLIARPMRLPAGPVTLHATVRNAAAASGGPVPYCARSTVEIGAISLRSPFTRMSTRQEVGQKLTTIDLDISRFAGTNTVFYLRVVDDDGRCKTAVATTYTQVRRLYLASPVTAAD